MMKMMEASSRRANQQVGRFHKPKFRKLASRESPCSESSVELAMKKAKIWSPIFKCEENFKITFIRMVAMGGNNKR